MSKKNIDKLTLGYILLKKYEQFCSFIFYRKTQAVNKHRIPKGKPIIFAPNHQNAVMDALAVLNTSGTNPVFLARADAFRQRFLERFLNFLQMLPVYRQRDGTGELAKNEEIFNITVGVLTRGNVLCLMPEGNHGNRRKLRPLVKGMFRIAFRAQEFFGEEDAVQIVPVGLDYEKYTNFRTKLFLNFGKPIPVSEYFSVYQDNPARAINALRNRLSEELPQYMIDIQSEEYYDTYFNLRIIYNRSMRSHLNIQEKDLYSRFRADKEMIRILEETEKNDPERMQTLAGKVRRYTEGVEKLGFRDWLFRRNRYSLLLLLPLSLLMLAGLPLLIYGLIFNIIPYRLPLLLCKKFKDPQFHSTVKFVIGMFLFPVYYLILFIPVWIFTSPGWIKWAFLGSLPVTGFFAHTYYIWFKKLRSMWRYSLMTIGKNDLLRNLKELRKDILRLMDGVVGEKAPASAEASAGKEAEAKG
jgi:1-acyl-sn-glycerol-3-phosphate acyltransferase